MHDSTTDEDDEDENEDDKAQQEIENANEGTTVDIPGKHTRSLSTDSEPDLNQQDNHTNSKMES
jgi:hypothetical protein